MMKRVGLSKFSPLEVSRKVQQCLRFEGVNANGVSTSNCTDVRGQRDSVQQGDAILTDHSHEDGSNKTNLLTTIKRKLRKTKRGKRCDVRARSDSLSNVCQCHSENCELHSCCSKHYRTRKHKPGDKCSVWPIAASILRCQNHQQPDKKNDDVAELLPEEPCSCFGAPTGKVNCLLDKRGPCSKLPAQASCSLSSLSCDVDPTVSSLPLLVESDGDSSRAAYSSIEADDVPVAIYARTVCSIDDPAKKILSPDLSTPRVGNLTQELFKLSKYGWYWGPINRSEAESKLEDQPDGAFLVRDSSDDRYILSLSFRSYGKTLHTRIEHSSGLFSFYAQPEPEGHSSIVELIQQSMCYSQSGVFCYSRSRSPGSPSFPVRLTKPISRFTQVRSLQYLCRFVIRQYTRYDHIQQLPLPPRIKGYLEEGHY